MAGDAANDTDPSMEAIQLAGLRAMSADQKLKLVDSLSRAVRELALADVRRRYPDEDERSQLLRAASRWIEPAVLKRGFGWDVDEHGY